MEYLKDGKLHGRGRHLNEDGRKTRTKRQILAPGAGILQAKFKLLRPS